jgi:hypothetical protein
MAVLASLAQGLGKMPPPETEAARHRRLEAERRRQVDALTRLSKATGPGPGPARRPTTPTAAPVPTPVPTPTATAEPSAPSSDPVAKAFLDSLDGGQRAGFEACGPGKRAQILERAAALGEAGFRMLASELARARPPAEAPPVPVTTAELLLALPGGDPALVAMAAQALAVDFGDAKSWRAFEGDCRVVARGEYPAEQLVDAYKQGMNPDSANPGAVYNTAIKRHGWKSRKGETASRGRPNRRRQPCMSMATAS